MRISHEKFCAKYLKIVDKNAVSRDFIFNSAQKKLNDTIERLEKENKPVRIIILKARQLGVSTYTESKCFSVATLNKNTRCGIITQKEDATTNLFNMSKNFYNNLPIDFRPQIKASNAKELIFDTPDGQGLGSKIKCMTAGAEGVGRSDTYMFLHISEYAFWKGDKKRTYQGLVQAVPSTPKTYIIIESTPNGFDDFKELWDKAVAGENDYVPLFFPWYEMKEYRRPYTGFPLTDTEEQLKIDYNLDNDQITWRRWCIKNNCLDDEEMFKQEYPSNPTECFLSTGNCIFDKEKIMRQLQKNIQPIKVGYFKYTLNDDTPDKICFEDDYKGFIKIYEEPIIGHPYVIGGDTSGEGSDFFTATVVDNYTGYTVAVLKFQFDEDLYACQMFCLGHYYNYALIGIEANFSSYPIKLLEKMGYDNMFIRITEDNYTEKPMRSFGFRTTVKTRPIIISNLVKMVRETPELFVDKQTLEEFLTFIRDENGKPVAQLGKHDDLVMSTAIAYYLYIGDQQSHTIDSKHISRINTNAHFWAKELEEDEEGEYIEWD